MEEGELKQNGNSKKKRASSRTEKLHPGMTKKVGGPRQGKGRGELRVVSRGRPG